jgi:hypothetical protein
MRISEQTRRAAVASVAAMIVVVFFQNCGSGFQSSSQPSSAQMQSVDDLDSQLKDMQTQLTQLEALSLSNPSPTLAQLNQALEFLREMLRQVSAIDPSGLSPSLQNLRALLMQQLDTDIHALEVLIASLPSGNPPATPPVTPPPPANPPPSSGGGVMSQKFQYDENHFERVDTGRYFYYRNNPYSPWALSQNAFVSMTVYYNVSKYDFVVPTYKTLTVRLWGGGGGWGFSIFNGAPGGAVGGPSMFASLIAEGGWGGNVRESMSRVPGDGGNASGGDVNLHGGLGTVDDGGNAPHSGGLGAKRAAPVCSQPAQIPGGGGSGSGSEIIVGAGSGAYVEKTYAPGELIPGATIAITVGGGAIAGAGSLASAMCASGAAGQVEVTWQ